MLRVEYCAQIRSNELCERETNGCVLKTVPGEDSNTENERKNAMLLV